MPTSDRSMNPTMQTRPTCLLTASARLQKRMMAAMVELFCDSSDASGSSYKHALGFLLPMTPLGPPMLAWTGRRTNHVVPSDRGGRSGRRFILACAGSARAQQDHATPQEVVQRVQQAAQAIAKAGEAGLATYGSKNDISVWKDSYVFIVSCEEGRR